MAIVLKDRVKETTAVTGTGTATLLGAADGYQSFSVIGNGNQTYYAIVSPEDGAWEVGVGTYTTSGATLSRTTVFESSNAGALVDFGVGVKDVFVTYPAERAIYEEPSGNTLIDGGPLTVIGSGVTGYTSFSAVLAEMYGNVNTFGQVYAQNYNDGADASADMIVYRDNTVVDTANFMDMGINSSNFSSATYPIFTPSSMYLYGDGGEMFIGSGTDDVIFFTGGVDVTDEAARFDKTTKNLTTVADVNVGGDLNATGGTFTAAVTSTSPSITSPANNEFVTKAYVDNAASAGLHIHTPVATETSAALSAVYVQGGTTFNITDITGTDTVVTSTTHGLSVDDEIWLTTTAGNGLSINTPYFVYATPTTTSLQLTASWNGPLLTGLTNASGLSYAVRANSGVGSYLEASANEELPIANVIVGDRVLVYQQSTGYWNGVYTVTSLGANDPGGSKWKLTRATDADYYSPASTDGLSEGDYFFVQSNSEAYVLTTSGPIIIGYTSITYTLFSSVPTYIVNAPLNLTGNTLSLTGTVAATNGGTGTNTVTTGDLLYGSASNTWSKLAAGSAYKSLVMNGSGTNVEWNAVALNQSGAVSGALGATNGGTGQSAYTTGDMIYSDTTNSLAKLSGNTSTTKQFLTQTGTGSASQAPAWGTISGSDVTSAVSSATNVAGGAANQIVYQTGSGATAFATAPTVSGTFLGWNGSALAWAAAGATITDDNSTNTSYYPVWSSTTSGSLTTAYVSSTNLSFNPGTGVLTALGFAGPLAGNVTGNVTGNVSGSSGSCSGNAGSASNVAGGAANQIPYQTGAGATSFIAAPTTASTSLTWNGSAFTWASAGGGVTISNDTTTNATYYPAFMTANSGSSAGVTVSSTKLTYNPSTGVLSATTHTSSSDETLKTNWRALPENFVPELAKVKHGIFDRIEEGTTEVGVSAQSLKQILEHAVVAGQDGLLSVNYGGAALVACIQLAEYVTKQEARIAALEQQLALKEIK